ncbi:MAG TPA: hypothetical protein VMS37_08885, partial [Verrucomicrobiae bacterium]|nr:hypothetical protein [Verrucomicrobiae bacterium]
FGNDYVGLTFSPDSNYLYLTRGTPENDALRALYVMPVFGGTPKQILVDIDSTVSFSPDGNRIAYLRWTPDRKDQYSEIHIAGKDGENNEVVYRSSEILGAPVWSPDGSRLAWTGTVPPARNAAIQVFDVSTKRLTMVPSSPDLLYQFSADGETNLLWTGDGSHLLALYRKHTDRTQIGMVSVPSGEFHPVTNDVNAYSQLAVSANGRTLATVLTIVDSSISYYKGDGGAPLATQPLKVSPEMIVWAGEDHLLFGARNIGLGSIDRASGKVQMFDLGEIDPSGHLGACPDGHILFAGFPKGGGEAQIFRMTADGGEITQLTFGKVNRRPSCSPDSTKMYYSVREGGNAASLWEMPVAGGATKQLIPTVNANFFRITTDSRLAGYQAAASSSKVTYTTIDLVSHAASVIPLNPSDLVNTDIDFSADGRAVIYSILQGDKRTLLYQPLDGTPPHTLTDPVPEVIYTFAISPTGKQLAMTRLKTSSDVVLITDQNAKEKK